MSKNINIQFFQRVSFLDKMLFTKHLSVMLTSGITIFEAVNILISQTHSDAFRKTLTQIRNDLDNGKLLSQALGKHPKIFNRFYISLVEVGEESGKLEENLIYLAKHLAKEYAFKKRVKGAMMYPIIIVVFATIVGLGLSLFVLPNLTKLFDDLNIPLPITTKILLAFSVLIRDHGILLLAGVILSLILFRLIISLQFIKPKWHALLLSLPVFGKILENIELTSFCRNMGVMMQSGLPVTKAMDVVYKAEENMVFKEYIKKLNGAITKGKSLAAELESGSFKRFPLIAVKMIGVGEKTGKLDETLLYLGDFFEEEVDDATKNIATVIEPILLLVIGLGVAFIAFAIISPIYEFTGSIKR